jgi:hypothetical protein
MHNMTYDVGGANIPIRRHSEEYDSARTNRCHGIKLRAVRNVGIAKRRIPGRRESETGRCLEGKVLRGEYHEAAELASATFANVTTRMSLSLLVERQKVRVPLT